MPNTKTATDHEVIRNLETKISELQKVITENSVYKHFFDESKDLVCIANLEGFFTKVNPAFTHLLGFSAEELESKPFNSFIHPDDIEKTSEEVKMMNLDGRSTLKFENRYITKSGTIVHLEWNSTVDEKAKTIFATARDVSKKKEIEEKLKLSERLLNEAQSLSKTGSWSWNFITNELYWSNEMYKIYQIDTSIQGKELNDTFMSLFPQDDKDHLNLLVRNAIEKGIPYSKERCHIFTEGHKKWIRGTGVPVKDKNGKVYKIEGIAQDITEIKESNDKLLRQDTLLKAAQTMAKMGSWSYNFETNELYWSDEVYNIFEVKNDPENKIDDDHLNRFKNPDREKLNMFVQKTTSESVPFTTENKITLPDGREKWIFGSGIPIKDESGKVVKMEGFVQDITEQKKSQLTILDNIREKEILIKELHHRVKNNMQVISSMLNLQSNLIDDDAVKTVFQESQQRIKSMAAVHDLLYKSNSLVEINFGEYINTLIVDLIKSYKGHENSIELKMEIPTISFNLEKAIPLGLFVNEIITNSLKHGFSNREIGQINFKLIPKSNDRYHLEISDDGFGFQANSHKEHETLGLMLIENLADQLDGKLNRISTQKGTIYTLDF